jgi:hypothetical protein
MLPAEHPKLTVRAGEEVMAVWPLLSNAALRALQTAPGRVKYFKPNLAAAASGRLEFESCKEADLNSVSNGGYKLHVVNCHIFTLNAVGDALEHVHLTGTFNPALKLNPEKAFEAGCCDGAATVFEMKDSKGAIVCRCGHCEPGRTIPSVEVMRDADEESSHWFKHEHTKCYFVGSMRSDAFPVVEAPDVDGPKNAMGIVTKTAVEETCNPMMFTTLGNAMAFADWIMTESGPDYCHIFAVRANLKAVYAAPAFGVDGVPDGTTLLVCTCNPSINLRVYMGSGADTTDQF